MRPRESSTREVESVREVDGSATHFAFREGEGGKAKKLSFLIWGAPLEIFANKGIWDKYK